MEVTMPPYSMAVTEAPDELVNVNDSTAAPPGRAPKAARVTVVVATFGATARAVAESGRGRSQAAIPIASTSGRSRADARTRNRGYGQWAVDTLRRIPPIPGGQYAWDNAAFGRRRWIQGHDGQPPQANRPVRP